MRTSAGPATMPVMAMSARRESRDHRADRDQGRGGSRQDQHLTEPQSPPAPAEDGGHRGSLRVDA